MRKFIRQVQASVEEIKEKEEKNLLIPSGSTLLNCACSGSPYGAYKAGTIVTLPGASASGKTMLLFTMFAEICQLKKFNNYELIYDDAEEALAINIRLLFGADAYERIESPSYTKEGDSVYSQTIQDFQNNILLQIKKGKSFIIKNHIIFIFERPTGRVKEKPKILEKNSFGASNRKGSSTSIPARTKPMLNLIICVLFFIARKP